MEIQKNSSREMTCLWLTCGRIRFKFRLQALKIVILEEKILRIRIKAWLFGYWMLYKVICIRSCKHSKEKYLKIIDTFISLYFECKIKAKIICYKRPKSIKV